MAIVIFHDDNNAYFKVGAFREINPRVCKIRQENYVKSVLLKCSKAGELCKVNPRVLKIRQGNYVKSILECLNLDRGVYKVNLGVWINRGVM